MLGTDRPFEERDSLGTARDKTRPDVDSAPPDWETGAVLADARTRQEYALAYRAKVDAVYSGSLAPKATIEAADDANEPAAKGQDGGGKPADRADTDGDEGPADRPGSIHDTPHMPDRYPDEYVPWDGPRRPVERPQALGEWLGKINPDGRGRWNNCGECARAVAKTWFGDTTIAAALANHEDGGESAERMAEWAGAVPVRASMADIRDRLATLGAGSLAIVGVALPGIGHWLNAVNNEGKVLAVDGQSGKSGTWPPTSLDARYDDSTLLYSIAVFFTPEGKVVRDDR
jgi:hypothetical protein